jgi:hypothetical protein
MLTSYCGKPKYDILLLEDIMGFVKEGGYVVATTTGSLVRTADISEQTLEKIAEILKIPKAERDQIISSTRSIYVYRGGRKPTG